MAKSYEAPPGVDIAALRGKTKSTAVDLMRPGEGTPWEDLGAIGVVKAFVQTCVKSITSPALLLDHMRRPESTREGSHFAYGCAALWGISTAIHLLILNALYPYPPAWGVDASTVYIKIAVLALVAAAGAFLLGVMFASRVYFALVSTELRNATPRPLLFNIFCYAMGPSILALIPVAGPPLALLFIFLAWAVGGKKRLYISWRGAIVAAVLTAVGVLLISAGVWFVTHFALDNMLGIEPPFVDPMNSPTGTVNK